MRCDSAGSLAAQAAGALLPLAGGSVLQVLTGLELGKVIARAGEAWAQMAAACIRFGLCLLAYFIYDWLASLLIKSRIDKYFQQEREKLVSRILNSRKAISQGAVHTALSQTILHLNDEIGNKWLWIGKRSLTALGAGIACFWLSPRLALCYLIAAAVLLWGMKKISRRSQTLQKRVLDQKDRIAELVIDSSRGAETVKAYQMEGVMEQRMEAESKAVYQLSVRSDKQRIKLTVVKYLASIASFLLILLASRGESIATLAAFIVLSQYIQSGLEMLDQVFYTYRLCKADWKKLKEIREL